MRQRNLIRLRPRADTPYLSSGRAVLATGADGFVEGRPEQGLLVHETRLLSHYRYSIDDRPLCPISLSNVTQRSWLGYYIAPGEKPDGQYPPGMNKIAQNAIELRLSRNIGKGMHEDVDLTNFTQNSATFRLILELDGDFADQRETHGERQQYGEKQTLWSENGGTFEWRSDYVATHRYSHQGERGEATMRRGIAVRFSRASSEPQWDGTQVSFRIVLPPHGTWHCCLDHIPFIDGEELSPEFHCSSFPDEENDRERITRSFLKHATGFHTRESDTLAHVVLTSLERGKEDLAALRLFDLDVNERAWTIAAGLPLYLALFGRDTLTVAWEAAPVTLDLMRGTLAVLPRFQGRQRNDWRDEEPGRMLHEIHTGPLSALNYNPQSRDYGSVTTSAFYPFVVAQLWHWTGDKELTRRFVEPAVAAIQWLDESCRQMGDGFSWYKTSSEQGVKNQSWKDSGDAIVYDDGSQVAAPIATCEQQGIVYAGKMNFAEVLWYLDRKEDAKRLYREAKELKKRFNEAFWMEDEGCFAMALDPKGCQVRSIGSNPLHCVATGVADESLIPRALERLFKPDMFTGWGVRTLSSEHPAYNPYAYHRGTVWPVEHGPFAVGAYRYGYHKHVEQIARCQFELASLFDFCRLPECVAGHQRDPDHPFPALYPAANSPQAWSATTVYTILQAMLGMQPFAPLRALLIDPHLPEWLPELTIAGMRTADAGISIRFFRKTDGSSDYEILENEGNLHVVRQPSPWSFTANLGERVEDLLASLLH